MKEIVIKISEEDYNLMKTRVCKSSSDYLILDGTPLPKGHGRLIDADDLMKVYSQFEFSSDMGDAMEILDHTPTIIEGSDSE